MRRRIGPEAELFQRPHWSPGVRSTSMPLRMHWVKRNDPNFRLTEAELDVLHRAAAGEDVGIPYLEQHKAIGLLHLYGVPAGNDDLR